MRGVVGLVVVVGAGTMRGVVGLVVVVAEDLQCKLDTVQSLGHVRPLGGVQRLLLKADLVHLGLGFRHLRKLVLQSGDLFLELRGLGGHLVDFRGQVIDLSLQVIIFGVGLCEFLVAISLLLCISCCLIFEFADQVIIFGVG